MRATPSSALLAVGAGVTMLLATACADTPTTPSNDQPTAVRLARAFQGASDGPFTLQWNGEAISLAGRHLLGAVIANRAYMLLSVAEARALDALSADARTSDDIDMGVASRAAALAGAAASVLAYIFPTDQAEVEAMVATLRESAPNVTHFDAALASGRAAGQLVVTAARSDGSDAVVVPVVPVGAGFWSPPGRIASPQWPFVRPMLMSSGSQFRPDPPPAFNSSVFLAALQRVRNFSDTRTAEQLAILNFWND